MKDGTRGIYLDHDRGSESVVVTADVIAKSLAEDYIKSQPAQGPDAGPGIFWMKIAITLLELREKFPNKLKNAAKLQHAWFSRLVRLADDLWTANHRYAQISDLDRTACRELGLKRDWLDDSPDKITKCPACVTLVSTDAIVCFACHAVLNAEKYSKLQFAGPVQALNK